MPLHLPGGDIDGDNCADIITFKNHGKTISRRALSRKTGNEIWVGEETFGPDCPFGTNERLTLVSTTALEVDTDGSTEVVVLTSGGDASQVIVLDGATGGVKWHVPSTPDQPAYYSIWMINHSGFEKDDAPSLKIVRAEKMEIPHRSGASFDKQS